MPSQSLQLYSKSSKVYFNVQKQKQVSGFRFKPLILQISQVSYVRIQKQCHRLPDFKDLFQMGVHLSALSGQLERCIRIWKSITLSNITTYVCRITLILQQCSVQGITISQVV